MYLTETERANLYITQGGNSAMTEEEILLNQIDQWLLSEKRRLMLVGQDYYENRNAIRGRRRLVIGKDGGLIEDPNLSNTRLAHGFAKKLVDQKTQYLFGKSFSLQFVDESYGKHLAPIFNENMLYRLGNLCKESINKGISWLQVFINQEGNLDFMKIPSEEVIPLWQDGEGRNLDGLIRVYEVMEYEGKSGKIIKKVEHWHPLGVDYYVLVDSKLEPDHQMRQKFVEAGIDISDYCPHFIYGDKGTGWGRVPFIPFRYNEEELPLIQFIKPLIDDYDLLKSEDSNSILDAPNGVLVIKNYDGTDLGEFRRNLAAYKVVKVAENGGLEHIQAQINTENINRHLAFSRKDLYELGRGVDTQNQLVGNGSGEYLKYLYADLDLDCNTIERHFKRGLSLLWEFIADYWRLNPPGFAWSKPELVQTDIIFNRDIIINETEAIANCVASSGLVSAATILANHPWVTDTVLEHQSLEADQQETETKEKANEEANEVKGVEESAGVVNENSRG